MFNWVDDLNTRAKSSLGFGFVSLIPMSAVLTAISKLNSLSHILDRVNHLRVPTAHRAI